MNFISILSLRPATTAYRDFSEWNSSLIKVDGETDVGILGVLEVKLFLSEIFYN